MPRKPQPKVQRKKLRFGIEFELFTLDQNGRMINGADQLIKRVRKVHPEIEIMREVGKNMIEIITPPHTEVPDIMLKAVEDFERVAACATEEGIILFAYGTYPGAFTPEFHSDKRYRAQEKILGKQRFLIAGRCIGLHIHCSLPWGVFDTVEKIIKPLVISKNNQSLVNVYNLCIAMDPALTTFTQSSPYYQGKRLGKDARAIVYRGGKELDYPQGLYANFPKFGALPEYKSTNTDLRHVIEDRFREWADIVAGVGRDVLMFSKHGSILDTTWNPVKINAHGTMEVRGMDMNHPDIAVAVAFIIQYLIKAVQEEFLQIVPSDVGVAEPFKLENGVLHIPPDSHVRSTLQKLAVYEGLNNDTVANYCAQLLKLARKYIPEKKQPLLRPLEDMLVARSTASDRIIAKAQELGLSVDELSEAEAGKLAVALSHDLYDEITITKEHLLIYKEEQ